MTDQELIDQIVKSDDRSAFGTLLGRYQSAVRAFLRRLTRGNFTHADDLAQETFIKVWAGLSQFRGQSTLKTWILGIAYNQWRNHQRKESRWSDTGEADESRIATDDPTPVLDLKQDLQLAFQSLSEVEQHVFHLGYEQGFTHSEIAGTLDIPIGTVKTHLLRGKVKLREKLAIWRTTK